MITPSMGRAMAAQLDRVNELDNPVVVRLRAELADARAEIKHLRERLAAFEDSGATAAGGPLTVHGRPAITVAAAARITGLSIATICRYCADGHWQAVQPAGTNRWLIYADQPLSKKQRGPRHV